MKKPLVLILVFFATAALAQRKNLIKEETFTKGRGLWYETTAPAYGIDTCTLPLNSNTRKAIKFTLRKGGIENRSEIGTDRRTMPKEPWVGFSVMFPDDYVIEKQDLCFTQMQAFPDPGERFGNPPFAIYTRNGRIYVDTRTDTTAFNRTKVLPVNNHWDIGPLITGKWMNIVYHIKWNYAGQGLVEVWINDKKVIDAANISVGYNDQANPYFKFGIYEYNIAASDVPARTIYFANTRVGNEKATYEDVYPDRKRGKKK